MSSNKVFKPLGASNHCAEDRQPEDYYATDPKAMELLLEIESFNKNVWECACGERHLSNVLEEAGYNVRSSDIINRADNEVLDFLSDEVTEWDGDIVTNPPFKYAQQFIEKAMDILPEGNRLALFLKIQFLEGKKRKELFKKYPPKIIYVSSSRLRCAKNGDFVAYKDSNAICYAWYIWEKGYTGDSVVKWFN